MSSNMKTKNNTDVFLWIKNSRTLVLTPKIQNNNFILKNRVISLFNSNDKKIEVESVSNLSQTTEISLKKDFDFKTNLFILNNSSKIYAYPTLNLLNKQFNPTSRRMGVSKKHSGFSFTLWSPNAVRVKLLIYSPDNGELVFSKMSKKGLRGLWLTNIDHKEFNVDKFHYMYEVTAFGKTKIGLDPYSKSMSSFSPKSKNPARGVVLDLKASRPYKSINNMANELDFIGMEAHIRDFSHSNNFERGTYKGFEERLGYFENLGITHIQLMPLHNFHTVDENNRSFQGDRVNKKDVNYNWGYDPQNYFTPEGWYSLDPSNPMSRVNELRNLVKKIHSKNMGAILDVVYNHVYDHTIFEDVAPGAYLRRNSNGDISYHTRAGASLESRSEMVRKLMIDSLKLWKNFYKFDGFRFDLMGFHDKETMIQIRKELGPDTILYGEAWEFTDLPRHIATTKSNLPKSAKLSAFNDTGRDSFTGVMQSKGFVQGETALIPKVKAAIIGGIKNFPGKEYGVSEDLYHRFATSPSETLNYLTIHDGFTLWDKINLSVKASSIERQRKVKQALAMLMTSQGKIILHGGVDIGRSKPLAVNDPSADRAHTSSDVNMENNIKYFHENSYKSPDSTNKINWKRADQFKGLSKYTKGLIELRRSLPSLRLKKADSIKNGLTFLRDYEMTAQITKSVKGEYAGYKSFTDKNLDLLTIEFIGAPNFSKNRSYYIAGELHSGNQGQNPKNNKFEVHFDKNGKGELKLSRNDLKKLNLSVWSDPESLQFKLVQIPGQWITVPFAYTSTGNNSLHPSKILKGNKAIIDLRISNHRAGDYHSQKDKFVAYVLDNTLEKDVSSKIKKLDITKVIVIHNPNDEDLLLKTSEINNPSDWKIYVDNESAGISEIVGSLVKIKKGQIIVPRNSSAVIGKR